MLWLETPEGLGLWSSATGKERLWEEWGIYLVTQDLALSGEAVVALWAYLRLSQTPLAIHLQKRLP